LGVEKVQVIAFEVTQPKSLKLSFAAVASRASSFEIHEQ
jgi:hypothetical protein